MTKQAYADAVRALNDAAYTAVRAGADTTVLPLIDRQSLRLIASETDRLVDDMEESGTRPSRISENRVCGTCNHEWVRVTKVTCDVPMLTPDGALDASDIEYVDVDFFRCRLCGTVQPE